MVSVKLYVVIYAVLLILAAAKWGFFTFFDYWTAMGLTLVSAGVKTALIAGYFQHLRYEPRSLTVLMLMALFAVVLLAVAASFSIT